MSLFLVTFFVLYGGMHVYFLLKARSFFAFGPLVTILIAVCMFLMLAGPVIVRASERAGAVWFALPVAYIVYVWMGFLFVFFSAAFLFDAARLAVSLGSFVAGKGALAGAGLRKLSFLVPVLVAVCVVCYGFAETSDVRIERLTVKTGKLPEGVKSIRIVQISDVHLGLMTRERWLRAFVNEVESARPDLLVSTGDLIDADAESLNGVAVMLRRITPRYGKFAITGNHEFYAGIDNFMRFARAGEFRVLRGEGVTVSGIMNVAGVDDIAGRPFHHYRGVREKDLLSGLPGERFTLLLKHRPTVDPDGVGLFDLQLSGHTHKGQIFPFNYVVRLLFPFVSGRFDLGRGSELYVSRGTGTWGPPIRFFSTPEITVVEVVDNKGT